MEPWVLEAREEIRDLVARYNANGDSGRFEQVMELFAPDAVMDVGDGRTYTGPGEIIEIFTGARDGVDYSDHPVYLRHMTATHQIDVIDRTHATGRCYFQVLTAIGLDHWGRYVDEYTVADGRWRFARRRVSVDGRSPNALFARSR
jgi:ketosteroid isomerase-like protein